MSDSKNAGFSLFIDNFHLFSQTDVLKKYAIGTFIFVFATFAISTEIYKKSIQEKKEIIIALEKSNEELKTTMNELKSDMNEFKKVLIEEMYESFEKLMNQNINICNILNYHETILSEILQQGLKKQSKQHYISSDSLTYTSSHSTLVSTYVDTPKKDDTNLTIVLPEILSAPNPYLIDKNSCENEDEIIDDSYDMLSADKKKIKGINSNYFWK